MKKFIAWLKTPKLPLWLCWASGNDGECQLCWYRVTAILVGFVLLLSYLD